MSDVAYLDRHIYGPHYVGFTQLARRAAARDESLPAAGVAPVYAHPFRPYTYRGTGEDTLTAWMDDEPEHGEPVTRRQERMEILAGLRIFTGHHPGDMPPGYVTALQAAEMLGVTVRTVERYKRDLRAGRPA